MFILPLITGQFSWEATILGHLLRGFLLGFHTQVLKKSQAEADYT